MVGVYKPKMLRFKKISLASQQRLHACFTAFEHISVHIRRIFGNIFPARFAENMRVKLYNIHRNLAMRHTRRLSRKKNQREKQIVFPKTL